ncbi:MAG: tetratricopeptide repeat protein [Cyclobacteriaceae bacterium]|nr:tetratricopeptide repeat protein [Cyclobacteriaceae bacterium]
MTYIAIIRKFKTLAFLMGVVPMLFFTNNAEAQRKKSSNPVQETKTNSRKSGGNEDPRLSEYYLIEAEKYFMLDDFAKAFVLYQKALEYDAANATAYFKMARIFQKSEDYDKALENAQKALQIDSKNKFFYLLVAEVYTQQSKFAEASAVYEELISKIDNSEEYLFDLAALYTYQEKLDKAIEVYDRVEERFGLNDQVIAQKQKLYLSMSKLNEAVKEGEKLIKAFPGEVRYVIALSEIFISNGMYEKAVPYLEELLEIEPNDAMAAMMLADIYKRQGKNDLSSQLIQRAFSNPKLDMTIKLQLMVKQIEKLPNEDVFELLLDLGQTLVEAHPDAADAYAINGDLLMRNSENTDALNMYLKAIELGATNYSLWQNTLQLLSQAEKFEEVNQYAQKALELYPNQPLLYYFSGTAYMIRKKYDRAIDELEQGKKLSGRNEELKSYFNAQLGDAYHQVDEHKKSDASYEAALLHNPNNDHVLNNYSYFLSLRKERLDQAKKMSSKLVKAHPDNPTYLDTYAWVLYQLGEYKEARIYIEKALEHDKLSGTIIEHYGDILFKLGEVDSAVHQWQRAKGMDDTSDLIDKKIADRKLYE